MPLVKCPTCGQTMVVNRNVVGDVVGCLTLRCETQFRAREIRRHSNSLSQLVFFGVILFAVFLSIVWLNRYWRWF